MLRSNCESLGPNGQSRADPLHFSGVGCIALSCSAFQLQSDDSLSSSNALHFPQSTIYNFLLSGQHYSLGCSPDVGRARVWLLECSGNYHSRNPLHQRCTNNTLNATGKYKYIAICFSVSHRNTALRIAQPCFISINHSYCLMAKMTCCRILQQLAKIT